MSNRVTTVLVLENMALTLLEKEGEKCSYYGYVPVDHLLSVSVNGYPVVTSRAFERAIFCASVSDLPTFVKSFLMVG